MCILCSNVPSAPTCLEVRNSADQFIEGADIGGTIATATAVSLGEQIYGAIGYASDIDMYALTLGPGEYSINLVGDEVSGTELLDSYLTIYNSAGTTLASDDDAGAGLYSYLTFTLASNQTIYVSAEGLTSSNLGQYFMSVQPAEISADNSTLAYIDQFVTLTGSIEFEYDYDWYLTSLQEGTTYLIQMTNSFGDIAGFIQIFDNLGNFLVQSNTDGELIYTATVSDSYYLAAGPTPFGTAAGTYTLDMNALTGIGWDAPNLAEPLASIDWGHVVPDNNTATGVTDINVYFVPGSQTFTDSDGTYTTGAWDAAEYNAALAAFQHYENVANVNFNVVTVASQADFFMVETTGTGYLGYFNVGGGTITLQGVNYTLDGHGVFDSGGTGWDAGGLAVGGYGYITLIHELGHGIGLAHPHDNGGSSSIMAGVSGPFGSLGTSGLNQGIYTTMSYNDGWYSLYGSGGPGSNNYGWQGTLMALDLAVLHDNYGANTTFSNGNNTYVLDTANAAGTYYECIWDTGGASDAINYSGSGNATINLNAATLTGTAAQGAGGFVSFVSGIYGGFTIANGVVIENANGGSGIDTITGNGVANVLNGGAGFDQLFGGRGNDTIFFDPNDDLANVLGGEDFDTLLVANHSVPLTFDLSSHQFERANVITDDSLGQWWLTVSDYYNSFWQLTNSDIRADDGRLVQSSFDVSPGGIGQSWQFVTDYRNAANTLTNQDGEFDNGTLFSKSYDYASGTVTDGISDEIREFTYFFRNDADKAAGWVYNVEGFYDDGRKFTQTNDLDSNNSWSFQTNWYMADGVTLDFLETRWDDGQTTITPY